MCLLNRALFLVLKKNQQSDYVFLFPPSQSSDTFQGFAVPTPKVPLLPPVNGLKANGSGEIPTTRYVL